MQDSKGSSFFELLGLPRTYLLDREMLEDAYRDRSKQWHPDRLGFLHGADRIRTLLRSAELNQAYSVMKDDLKRAEYLISLYGIFFEEGKELSSSDSVFLSEILELKDDLEDAKQSGASEKEMAIREKLRARYISLMVELTDLFSKLERGEENVLSALVRVLTHLRFYRRFLDS